MLSVTSACILSLVVNGSGLAYLFSKSPFRYSQFIGVLSLFSFSVRPLAVEACDAFRPFYFFSQSLYDYGVLVGNGATTLYVIGLLFGTRRTTPVGVGNLRDVRMFTTIVVLICAFIDLVSLAYFGVSILPGLRTTGLQEAASGSQIAFALVSVLTTLGVGAAVFAAINDRKQGGSLMIAAMHLTALFALSMIFYQRGPFIIGILFGFFLSGLVDSRFYRANLARNLLLLSTIFLVAAYGRDLVTNTVLFVLEDAGSSHATISPITVDSEICKLANSANQEHDQVWPSAVSYVDRFGPDWYRNLIASLFRPFLSAMERDSFQLFTATDQLNIFNSADVYLSSNFGFSLSPFQYHYYSLGIFFLLVCPCIGWVVAKLENKSGGRLIDISRLVAIFYIFSLAQLTTSPIDEQLKWTVVSLVVAWFTLNGFRIARQFFPANELEPLRPSGRR
jgi:hypothetical protein